MTSTSSEVICPPELSLHFGVTRSGGPQNYGTVFELKYVTGVGWQEIPVYNFTGSTDGSDPSGVTFDGSGNLYGVTRNGGSGGGGTIFELSPSGNSWTYKLLHSFVGPPGCGPARPLTFDGTGNFYGTTICDGDYTVGNIFKLSNTGNGWVYSSLHDFDGLKALLGAFPESNVTIDTDGTLYGTANAGGSNNNGVVWMIKP